MKKKNKKVRQERAWSRCQAVEIAGVHNFDDGNGINCHSCGCPKDAAVRYFHIGSFTVL